MYELASVVCYPQEPPRLLQPLNSIDHVLGGQAEFSGQVLKEHHLPDGYVVDEVLQLVLVLGVLKLLVPGVVDGEHVLPLVVLLALGLLLLLLLLALFTHPQGLFLVFEQLLVRLLLVVLQSLLVLGFALLLQGFSLAVLFLLLLQSHYLLL